MREQRRHPMRPNPACGVSLRSAVAVFSRVTLSLLLAVSVALIPLDIRITAFSSSVTYGTSDTLGLDIQRNEAQAIPPAIAGAGAALAALAAELGISETALIFGIGAIGVAATGIAVTGSDWTDTDLPPVPGALPWDDLPPAVQDRYRGYDNPAPEEYYNDQVARWAIMYGVVQSDGNGGLEPTPEPDPNNDPDGYSRWMKARNVLTLLGTGAAGVALNDALGPLVDNAAHTLKDFLFGGDDVGGFGVRYESNYQLANMTDPISFITFPGGSFSQNNYTYSWTENTWSFLEDGLINTTTGLPYYELKVMWDTTQKLDINSSLREIDGYKTLAMSNYYYGQGCNNYWVFPTTGEIKHGGSSSSTNEGGVPKMSRSQTSTVYLNAQYAGKYIFPNGLYYENGEMSGNVVDVGINYGQMVDTPQGITANILNNQAYTNFINNYTTSDLPEDYKRAVTIPRGYGEEGYQPSYDDFVQVTPESEVSPVPDDEPVSPDNPTPTPDQQYRDDFGQQVGRLLAQPFTQLFPFCLITDLYDMTQVIEGALYGGDELSAQSTVSVNGTAILEIPLEDFNIDGLENIELDLTDIKNMVNMVRPWTTSLFIIFLLVGSFRFFINRGGE